MKPGSFASHPATRGCRPSSTWAEGDAGPPAACLAMERLMWDWEWKEVDGTGWTKSQVVWDRKGSMELWCLVQDALAPRHQAVVWCQGDTARGPPASICWDRTWECTVEPASPPSHFFFQKMASVNKLSVHMCFGIWMGTLVCVPPPAPLPPSLGAFAKWAFLAQFQLQPELFHWHFPPGLITSWRSRL